MLIGRHYKTKIKKGRRESCLSKPSMSSTMLPKNRLISLDHLLENQVLSTLNSHNKTSHVPPGRDPTKHKEGLKFFLL